MRTSRLSKDTSKIAQALAPQRRQTRNSLAASALRNFAYSESSSIKTESSIVKSELDDDDSSSLSSANTEDIEDLLEPPAKRRRRNVETPPTSIGSGRRVKKEEPTIKAEAKTTIKAEEEEARPKTSKPRRQPVRKIKREDGSVDVQPPSNWETMYEIVKKMRAANPTAPVDTMGCAELHWKSSPLKDQRFQTLIALMLSSQTKDTVTAPAMHRLHTELGEQEESPSLLVKKEEMKPSLSQLIKAEEEEDDIDGIKPHAELKPSLNSLIKKEENDDTDGLEAPAEKKSTLTLKNILAVSPERLNELIRTVGFHNNKTKYIKQVALILRDQYDGDIPSTVDGLMKLPGVGPKMSYLCMSAAWGKHEGIGVDVHVHRITNMWGWHTTKNPEETRMALQSWLPKDKWHEINKLLVGLGQTACLPVARRCGECDLAGTGLCKSEIRGILARTKKEKEEEEEEAKVKIERV